MVFFDELCVVVVVLLGDVQRRAGACFVCDLHRRPALCLSAAAAAIKGTVLPEGQNHVHPPVNNEDIVRGGRRQRHGAALSLHHSCYTGSWGGLAAALMKQATYTALPTCEEGPAE